MGFLIRHFLRGLLVVVPAGLTVWILYSVFVFVDDLFRLSADRTWTLFGMDVPGERFAVRGVGFLLMLVVITGIGFLTTNILTRWIFARIERLFARVPVVKLVYASIKDLIEAFVSEKKKFDKPVLLDFGGEVRVVGFVTRDSMEEFGLEDQVAVYVPQSYNFAANLIVVPRERVTPIELPSAAVMAFVVSGGVSQATRETGTADADEAKA